MRLADGLRLLFGTLTVLPVGHPRRVDRSAAGIAMGLAPVAGAALGALVGLPIWLLSGHFSELIIGVAAVGWLAFLTRAMHLDGLADTLDGLGSGKPAEQALTIMKQSDIGPFGVVALIVALGLQVAALASLGSDAAWAVVAALIASRGVLAPATLVRAARADGLGHAMARSIPLPGVVVSLAGTALLLGGVAWLAGDWSLLGALVGPVVGMLALLYSARRFGGVTGDVYGAAVEVAWTAALLACAFKI